MLPRDMVIARLRDGKVRPQYIATDDPALLLEAATLITLFKRHLGHTHAELQEALDDFVSAAKRPALRRGLVKLLLDHADFAPVGDEDPVLLRRRVFLAAAAHKRRAEPGSKDTSPRSTIGRTIALQEVAKERGLSIPAIEEGLFADLKGAEQFQRLAPIEPGGLLQRYNVALAQGVLLSASRLVVEIEGNTPARYRQLLRFVKFFGLSFLTEELEPTSKNPDGGLRLVLDGPLSLFKRAERYGLRLAKFLPALLLCEGWRLTADLLWGKARRQATFVLTPRQGLCSHYRDTGAWVPEEQRWFEERFATHRSPWTLAPAERLVSLGGQGALVPDYLLRHQDGREVLL